MRINFALGLAALFVACSSSSSNATPDASVPDSGADASVDASPDVVDASSYDASAIVAARPYTTHVPMGYDPGKPTPLVVAFHGATGTGAINEAIMRLVPVSDAHGFLYAYGEGTVDPNGDQFWNATDACCDHFGTKVDDVMYFDAIVDDMASKYNVDKKRVFVIGHSNGGFMAHRLACDRASRVAAIASLAGVTWSDASKCAPTEHVSVLQVHGDADTTILYGGGVTYDGGGAPYPSAHASAATWAQKNGCTGAIASTGMTYDLEASLAGNETSAEAYSCPAGIDVALWTIHGGRHIPTLNHPGYGEAMWTFFAAHAKP